MASEPEKVNEPMVQSEEQLKKYRRAERKFWVIGVITMVAIYLAILAGGVVRASGAGMGCPDWPKCFGSWVPPTDVSQLPHDYQEKFDIHGHGIDVFNPLKTWTEYVNRLIGASTGPLALLMIVFSIPLLKRNKIPFIFSIITFILLGLEGLLGARVVQLNLEVGTITLHMIVALFIVFSVVVAISWKNIQTYTPENISPFGLKILPYLSFIVFVLLFVQIILGTDVREEVDLIEKQIPQIARDNWVDNLGTIFSVHRSFSIIILLFNFGLIWSIYRYTRNFGAIYLCCSAIYFFIAIEVLLGMSLAYLGMPGFLQPLHMLVAGFWIGVNFFVFLTFFKQLITYKESATLSNQFPSVAKA